MSNDGLPRVSRDGQLLDDRGLLERAYTAHSRQTDSNFNLDNGQSLWDANTQQSTDIVDRRSFQSRISPYEQRPYRPVSTTPYMSSTRKSKLNENNEEEHHRRMNSKSALGYIEGSGEHYLSHLPASSKNYEQRIYITRQTYLDANKSIMQQQRIRRPMRRSVVRNASLEQNELHESSNFTSEPIGLENRLKRNVPSAKQIVQHRVHDELLSDSIEKISNEKHTPSRASTPNNKRSSSSERYEDDALDSSRSFDSTTTIDSEVERFLMGEDDSLSAYSKHAHLIDKRVYDAFVEMLSRSDELSDSICLKEILDSVEQAVTERRLLKNYAAINIGEKHTDSTKCIELERSQETENTTEESAVHRDDEIGDSDIINDENQSVAPYSEAIGREAENIDGAADGLRINEIESSDTENSTGKEPVELWDEQEDERKEASDFDDQDFEEEEEFDVDLISENGNDGI